MKSKTVVVTSPKHSPTNSDNIQQDPTQQTNGNIVTVSTGDAPSPRTHVNTKQAPARTASRSIPDRVAAPSPTGGGRGGVPARGSRKLAGGGASGGGADRGSDSDTRRRDERVRFAADTVVQTADGRAVIVDDSATAADRRPTRSRQSASVGGTLPARLRGQAVHRAFSDLDHQAVRRPAQQRVQVRPLSAVFDSDDQRGGPSSGPSQTTRTGSIATSMNALHHRGSSASRTRAGEFGVLQPPAHRRTVDVNYYRDTAAASRLYRR